MKRIFKFFLNAVPRPLLIKASYWVRPLLATWLKGDTFTDPIDGRSFSRFLPYGYEQSRENVLSPSTLSLERHRLLWLFLKEHTDFFEKPAKLLHVAPEQAFHKRFKDLDHLEYVTTDLFSPLADVKADLRDLPFPDNDFDIILCNHVLEHIEEDRKAMKELYRVMKPGGWGVFQVPQDLERETTYEDASIREPDARAAAFGQYDHVRVYGKDYFDRLREAGFEVEEVALQPELGPELTDRYRLSPSELIPLVRKPVS